jgi:succinate dehydrogenase / fumarate reductase membrane anchor subunit
MDIPEKIVATPSTHYGSGRSATWRFIVQRVTGLLNVAFTIFLIWLVVRLAGADVATMQGLLANPVVAIVTALLIISAAVHMEIGMREVIDDYVHGEGAIRATLTLNTVVAVVVTVAALIALFKLAFWG